MSTDIAPIVLPWFPAACKPNSRSGAHWAKTKAMKQTRGWGATATRAAMGSARYKPPAGRIAIQFTFYPPTRRARDDDNLTSSVKGYRDGIADALGVDDNLFDMQKPIVCEPVKGGKIVVTLG